MEYYLKTTEQVLKELNSSEDGLSNSESKRRKEQYGANELEKEKKHSPLLLFFSQFKNTLILLLLFATGISVFLGEFIDATAMFVIVMISVSLGFFQEYRAEKAIEALKKVTSPTARVIRNGEEAEIPAIDLVPGDIILLEEGDIVPADARVLESTSLKVNEGSLTGESMPSEKLSREEEKKVPIADQDNMLFMGTVITYGKGTAVVIETGMRTQLGKIASSLEGTKEPKTPLQRKFEKMAKQIGIAVIILVIIVFFTGMLQGQADAATLLIFALSLAVASVPSVLPAIVTIGLSLGSRTLAKQNMIIKSLPATESLGNTTIICSDKTGTLTKNEMTITKIFANLQELSVTGSGYSPKGSFLLGEKKFGVENISKLLQIGVFCNNAHYTPKGKEGELIGDPTEGSLLVLAEKAGMKERKSKERIVAELPFDSDRKMMSVVVEGGQREAFVKGAPDLLIKKCTHYLLNGTVKRLSVDARKEILEKNNLYAEEALRVLGLAFKPVKKQEKYTHKDVETNLVFVGLVGMIDPPRDGVKEAIVKCKKAGIRVMMITGDHALTAKAVGKKIGLFEEGDVILRGEEIEKMSESELEKKIKDVSIIARALPIQKSRIVDALKKQGHIVAMTGDGVNDAPALKKADIGIAMGITGTDVAKEVSKGILVDDHFATIVNAIAEGRNIYDKIIKSTRYLLSCNSGEIFSVFIAIMLGFPLPLLPLQILLMNLVTDGLPAFGLGAEPSEKNVMDRPPRDPRQNPLSGGVLATILLFGATMGLGTLLVFSLSLKTGISYAQTMAFTTLVMYQMFAVMGIRSLEPFKKLNPFSNKWLLLGIIISISIQIMVIYTPFFQNIFGTTAISLLDWAFILVISFSGFLVMEFGKFFIHSSKFYKAL